MPKHNKYNPRAFYFTDKLKDSMALLLDYPCTIVEAPMGYGKTTAVREYLNNTNSLVLWQKIYDNSITGFWGAFCRLLGDVNKKCSESLAQMGFPNDSTLREEAIRLLQNICFGPNTVIVLDDYHLIDCTEVNSFIEFLLLNEIPNLHLVITARYTRFNNIEELVLKGYLNHIAKQALEFSPQEIITYYSICGINIKANEADNLYKYTEGWVSALYLLMLSYNENGSFMVTTSITKLIEKTVYMPFCDEIKEFLLHISFFDSFTLEQATHMWQNENTQQLLDEIISKNAFITYDAKAKIYQVHKMFLEFLKEVFQSTNLEYKNSLYAKAAQWYLKVGSYSTAMHYYYICNNFDGILNTLETDKGHSMHNEYRVELIKYFDECPEHIKYKHPISLLIYALCLFSYNEIDLLKATCNDFIKSIQANSTLDDETIKKLMGEFELLICITNYNDIKEMHEHIKQAYILLQYPTTFMDTKDGWTFGSPSVLYMFHRKAGQLENEVNTLKEAMLCYSQLVNGHGKGGEYVMEAEKHFNCGDYSSAEISIHKALYMASTSKQDDIVLCSVFLQARIAVVKGDYAYAFYLLQKQREEVEYKSLYSILHTLDLCEAFLQISLQRENGISKWILDGDFTSTRLYFPAMGFFNIVYGRVLLIKGEYLKLLGIAEQFIETASIFSNLLAHIYTYIYIAAANEKIFRRDAALEALQQALDFAVPDKIIMPFVENCDYIKPLLDELYIKNIYKNEIADILKLYRPYQNAIEQMTNEYFIKNNPELTQRELEVAQLVADGLSNNEIGKKLFISQNTVKTLLKRIFEKLGISSRTMLKQYIDTKQ